MDLKRHRVPVKTVEQAMWAGRGSRLTVFGPPAPAPTFCIARGTKRRIVRGLDESVREEGTDLEVIAPKITGATLSDGKKIIAQQKIDADPPCLRRRGPVGV